MLAFVKTIAPLTLYFLGIIIFFLSITGRVKYGLWFLVPLLPLQNIMEKMQQFPLGKDFNDILLVGMIIGWAFYNNSRRKPLFEKNAYNKIFFFYLIFTFFTLWKGSVFLGFPAPLNPADPRLQNWKNYMVLPLLFLVTFNNVQDKQELKRLFVLMCITMFLMNYYTIQQISWIGSWQSRVKLQGTFVWLNVNAVAAFYATYTFILIGIFLSAKEKYLKIISLILTLQNLYCVVFLFSRGAYLATLAGFFLISILRKKILLIPIILLLIFWQSILPQSVIERIMYTEQEGQLDLSAQSRFGLWQESIEFFKLDPLTGIGFNALQHMQSGKDTHNIYLRTLAEQGAIGLLFLLIIIVLAFFKGLKLYKRSADRFLKGLGLGFLCCVVAVAAGNFFGDRWTHLPLAAYFWVFLGMVERGILLEAKPPKKA